MKKFTHLYDEWEKLYLSGVSTIKIAEQYGTTHSTVRKALLRQGIKLRTKQETSSKYAHLYDDWLKLYNQGWSAREIAEKYNVGKATVTAVIEKYGSPRSHSEAASKYSQYYHEWLKRYSNGESAECIAKDYGCDLGTVLKLLKQKGYIIRNAGDYARKYNIENEDFFEQINTEYKAYFLGFLMADGYIYVRSQGCKNLQLTIKDSDRHLLDELNYVLGSNYPVQTINNNGYPAVKVVIQSAKLVDDLNRHGCFQRKSKYLTFPTTVPKYLLNHFLRGYIDGDGCIYINQKRKQAHLSINGTREFLEVSLEILANVIGDSQKSLPQVRKDKGIYVFALHGNRRVKKCLDWLYQDAHIYLQRKYARYMQVCALCQS